MNLLQGNLPNKLLLLLFNDPDPKSKRAEEIIAGYEGRINDITLKAIADYMDKHPEDKVIPAMIDNLAKQMQQDEEPQPQAPESLLKGLEDTQIDKQAYQALIDEINKQVENYNQLIIEAQMTRLSNPTIGRIQDYFEREKTLTQDTRANLKKMFEKNFPEYARDLRTPDSIKTVDSPEEPEIQQEANSKKQETVSPIPTAKPIEPVNPQTRKPDEPIDQADRANQADLTDTKKQQSLNTLNQLATGQQDDKAVISRGSTDKAEEDATAQPQNISTPKPVKPVLDKEVYDQLVIKNKQQSTIPAGPAETQPPNLSINQPPNQEETPPINLSSSQ